ncbi:MAG: cytochrome C biogenesis protein CcdA [Blastopirellula sp.]|nr:MAG: cytochrome C biogenesis protein CcdA [Blastopirellula sp.]
MKPIIVTTTTATKDEAVKIADILLNENLAACVQISQPVLSCYRWEGEIKRDEEFVCSIKTEASHFNAIARVIEKVHSYDVPQIIAVPIVHGSVDYLSWVQNQVDEHSTADT